MFLNYIIFRMCFLFVSSATNVFKEAADLERSFLFLSFVFKPGLNDLLCTHNMTRELDEPCTQTNASNNFSFNQRTKGRGYC